jgi:uncharacterized protein with NAD-binding domain and iron-sulfur cluster
MAQRPDFIYQGGSVLMHTPLQLQQADMYGFFVKGDIQKLQRSVDATLNAVAGTRMQFKVLSPYVMLTFTQIYHAHSDYPADQAKGWGKETDIVTWIMVGQMETKNGKSTLSRIYSYPFHIWVDDVMALINGRELLGYPKYACDYTMPAIGADPDRFTLAAKGFQPFSPDTELAMHPLLEVAAVDKSKAHRPLASFLSLLREGFSILKSEPDFWNLNLAGMEDLAGMALKPHVDQIFLKQFPDSAGVKAVYQAIVTAPARVDTLKSAQLLGYRYRLTLHPFASFPLDQTLGLRLGEQDCLLPFHVNFDFTVTQGEELIDNSRVEREKIAILGGGVGSMTAAFFLTDQPDWQNRYDITLYQMGWRLGGKGASGRNAALGQRIEEHGLHIWFGFYDNAFAMMQKAYTELKRPVGAPLRTWDEAFKPQHFIALTELIGDQWKIWPIDTPLKPGVPGHGNEAITPWQIALTLFEWIKQGLGELRDRHGIAGEAVEPAEHRGLFARMASAARHAAGRLAGDVHEIARAAHAIAAGLPQAIERHSDEDHRLLGASLRSLKAWMEKELLQRLDSDDALRRLFILLDLGMVSLIGMLEDGVLRRGFDVINDIDFYAWLEKHHANKQYTVYSAPVRGFYDLVFAYEDGDFDKPNIEAGTMLSGMLKVAFCYHGGMMWKMQAGMGDAVFTPLYELLKQRGVKFKFFHKVEELIPNAMGDGVAEIRLTEQVALLDEDKEYDPLVPVKGLACWPSEPKYELIAPAQAKALRENRVNLESHWSNWGELYEKEFKEPLPQVTLRQGRDFDKVVFGISVGSVAELCPQLLRQNAALKIMTEKVKAVATQAYQVWSTKDVRELGWTAWPKDGQEPVMSGFWEPFDTWAPMDQLLCREDWPARTGEPKSVSYFCSALPLGQMPPPSDHTFPALCAAQVKQAAIGDLKNQLYALWPKVASEGSFDWSCLLDPAGNSGEQRFDSQYWRANVDPSERYVLSLVDSSRYRLRSNESGFRNLYLAGDWVKTGINAGCVEAAAMGGMQASQAISGYPVSIKGDDGW